MEKPWVVLYRIPCTYGCIVVLRCTISTCDRDLKPLYVLDKEVVVANRKFFPNCAWRAKQATSTIPIVMVNSLDAVKTGLVASLSHPGANVTGRTSVGWEHEPLRLKLLKEDLREGTCDKT
jgi:hypothetical protein